LVSAWPGGKRPSLLTRSSCSRRPNKLFNISPLSLPINESDYTMQSLPKY
jgi:hypothetical protein